jgi:hypothetical protein
VLNVLLIFLYFITILGKSHAVFVVFVLDTEALALVFLLAFDFPVSFCIPVLHIDLLSGATALKPFE